MIIFIYICILILNLAAILMTYKFLGKDMEQKEKLIFVIVGVAIIYVTVSLVYWLSTKSIQLETSNNFGKNFIIFTFVPINSIVILPFLGSSYKYYKEGRLKQQNLKNRIILISIILVIILIIEFFYFKDIQSGILNIVKSAQ